jgi:hypothetical protein
MQEMEAYKEGGSRFGLSEENPNCSSVEVRNIWRQEFTSLDAKAKFIEQEENI